LVTKFTKYVMSLFTRIIWQFIVYL
jgi:hypothetical protein